MASETRRFAVKGMHCAACAGRIERILGKLPGVAEPRVNLAAETLDVRLTGESSFEDLQDSLRDAGFELAPEATDIEVNLAVTGMTCAACSRRVERTMAETPGVLAASVNLATETGRVRFDPDRVSLRAIRQAVQEAGYDVRPVSTADLTAVDRQEQETMARLKTLQGKFLLAAAFALPLLYVSMGHMIGLPLPAALDPMASPAAFALTQLALTLPALWAGRDFFRHGFPNLWRLSPNMDSLIAVGATAAVAYSLWNTVEILLGQGVHERVMDLYYESAAVILAMVMLGKFQEYRSRARTSEAIRGLMKLRPKEATLIEDGAGGSQFRSILVEEIAPGDVILVRPGEIIPVDGQVLAGVSGVNEAMLTGESLPVDKGPGAPLIGGSVNGAGALRMRAERVGGDTVLARIIRLVQEAQGSKAPIANLADRISLYFVPTVIGLALLTGLVWYFAAGAGFSSSLRYFISVLVIACPCAMGLATPTAIMVGAGRGAQLGVLIKSGAALEIAHKLQVLVFDKTGTLTHGRPEITDVVMLPTGEDPAEPVAAPSAGANSAPPLGPPNVVRLDATAPELRPAEAEDDLLTLAAALQSQSEHPLAQAILRRAQERRLPLAAPERFEVLTGRGVRGVVNGVDVAMGNPRLMEELGVAGFSAPKTQASLVALAGQGKTPLCLAVRGRAAAIVAVADALKPEAPEVVRALQDLGLETVMLTGDNRRTAEAVAAQAGVARVLAEVLPERKAEEINRLKAEGKITGMVGDGVNDAPALAAADLGVAMGTGIDVAIESGDVVLMRGDLRGVLSALALSRAVVRVIKQNLFWAFAFNVLGIPLAAGVLRPFDGPALSPMFAAAAMAFSSVTVVTNALRLRFFDPAARRTGPAA